MFFFKLHIYFTYLGCHVIYILKFVIQITDHSNICFVITWLLNHHTSLDSQFVGSLRIEKGGLGVKRDGLLKEL